jgi:DNA-binding response OmpR family regulator
MAARRILVIEDEPGSRDALQSLLADDGYAVCTAATGRAGLERLHDFRPDTIVCDFYLPDTNGLELLRAARAAAREEITFIIVTADCGGEAAELMLRREADHFFHKPIDLARLRGVLQRTTPAAHTACRPTSSIPL